MTETRKHFTAEQKMTALRRHLLEHMPVSNLCDEYGVNPTVLSAMPQMSHTGCIRR
jgi:transposase-like protein